MMLGLLVSLRADLNAVLIWSTVSAWYPLKPSKAEESLSYLIFAVKVIGGRLNQEIIEIKRKFKFFSFNFKL